ncbi:hypothetical protein BCY86_03920 [Pajaroellobacter abortibovis]|uniref:Polyprenyl synthetase n=1 Tax=Pajaroellobacter abortibovis TaxID=1882918 RepID=A0A1L6MZQ2_9BACT|nr:hypothetical protein BCY86_03920 [Pajaroellobacter abortibovis]
MTTARALLQEDIVWVEERLKEIVKVGVSPATEVASYLLESGGKWIRPIALLLSMACFGPIDKKARELAVVVELVHLATLLHDDVVDEGQERRGRLVARRIWGNAVSVLAGDLLLTHALERTHAVGYSVVLQDLIGTLRQLVDGEVIQLNGRTRTINEEEYFQVIRQKTASLFAWAARAGAYAGKASQNAVNALGDYGFHLGVAFQLIDDVLDYVGDPKMMGKLVHADLCEGKQTLPLILLMKQSPKLEQEMIRAREGNEQAIFNLIEGVNTSGVCHTIRFYALEETKKAIDSLEAIPSSPSRDLLASVAHDLGARLP